MSPTFRVWEHVNDWIARSLICGADGRQALCERAERVHDLCARATTMSEEEEVPEQKGWFSRLATGLAKSVGEGLDLCVPPRALSKTHRLGRRFTRLAVPVPRISRSAAR